jgi:hypothetical protein
MKSICEKSGCSSQIELAKKIMFVAGASRRDEPAQDPERAARRARVPAIWRSAFADR